MSINTVASTATSRLLPEGEYYEALTSRNFHFIKPETQKKLSKLTVLVAGCGSTGGACTSSLARVGIKNFHLADNGTYELSNLNRQHARLSAIDENKAQFHSSEILSINPYAKVQVFPEGLTPENTTDFLRGGDIVMDAVDVTTTSGMEAKIRLHEECSRIGLPVFSALDLGYRQWGYSFDYRKKNLLPLEGRSAEARKKKHPISSLFTIYPLHSVPDHALQLIDDLLEEKSDFASQLGATSDLLSSIIVAAMIRYVESGELLPGWSIDLWEMKESRSRFSMERLKEKAAAIKLRRKIAERIARD
jgi:hypothetical protein